MEIAIYVEGGGDGAGGKQQLRLGFDALLARHKSAARERRLGWRLTLCGNRNDAVAAFHHATERGSGAITALLVDAEGPVADSQPAGRVAHLQQRDGWDLRSCPAEQVHLMTQCMEAWIVADAEVLAKYYGKGFQPGGLPKRTKLDEEPKDALYTALATATKKTQKGRYGKIRHAADLLHRLRPDVVAARCESFRQFSDWLGRVVQAPR